MLIAGIVTDIVGALSFASDPIKWLLQQMATALKQMLTGFAHLFLGMTHIGLRGIITTAQQGSDSPGALIVWAALGLAVIGMFFQVAKTAILGRGAPLAQAIAGLVRTLVVLAAGPMLVLLAVTVANSFATAVVKGSMQGQAITSFLFHFEVGGVLNGGLSMAEILSLVVVVIMVLSLIVLYIELLVRNVAIVLLLFSLPLAAAGSMLGETSQWWQRARSQLIGVIMLKPVIALIFAFGFLIGAGTGTHNIGGEISATLTGAMVLVVAAFAWPMIARYMAFHDAERSPLGAMVVGAGAAAGTFFGRKAAAASTGGAAAAGETESDDSMASIMESANNRGGGGGQTGAPSTTGSGTGSGGGGGGAAPAGAPQDTGAGERFGGPGTAGAGTTGGGGPGTAGGTSAPSGAPPGTAPPAAGTTGGGGGPAGATQPDASNGAGPARTGQGAQVEAEDPGAVAAEQRAGE